MTDILIKTDQPIKQEGLQARLAALSLKVPIKNVMIPEGKSEREIWEIFQIIFDNLDRGDEVVFDITHSFRSIPMLVMVVLNYAKVVKSVSLKGIYYGAFEVLGTPAEVEKMPLAERLAPIFDMTPFDSLMDWSVAIDRFLGAGDASLVAGLAKEGVKPLLAASEGSDVKANQIRKVANAMEGFSRSVATCRGKFIAVNAAKLRNLIESCDASRLIPAFQPLLHMVAKKMEIFNGDELKNGLAAAKWCLEHNLIQQGFTILREALISFIVSDAGCNPDEEKNRETVSYAVKLLDNSSSGLNDGQDLGPNTDDINGVTLKYLELLRNNPTLMKLVKRYYSRISQYRNDINHAGFKHNVIKAEYFGRELESIISGVEAVVLEN